MPALPHPRPTEPGRRRYAWLLALCSLLSASLPAASPNGDFELHVLARHPKPDGTVAEVTVQDGDVLRSGDGLQIRVVSRHPQYLYLAMSGSTGRTVLLLSGERDRAAEGRTYTLPGRDEFYLLDDHTGYEAVYAFAAPQPLDDVRGLLRRMEALGADERSAYARLREAVPNAVRIRFRHVAAEPLFGVDMFGSDLARQAGPKGRVRVPQAPLASSRSRRTSSGDGNRQEARPSPPRPSGPLARIRDLPPVPTTSVLRPAPETADETEADREEGVLAAEGSLIARSLGELPPVPEGSDLAGSDGHGSPAGAVAQQGRRGSWLSGLFGRVFGHDRPREPVTRAGSPHSAVPLSGSAESRPPGDLSPGLPERSLGPRAKETPGAQPARSPTTTHAPAPGPETARGAGHTAQAIAPTFTTASPGPPSPASVTASSPTPAAAAGGSTGAQELVRPALAVPPPAVPVTPPPTDAAAAEVRAPETVQAQVIRRTSSARMSAQPGPASTTPPGTESLAVLAPPAATARRPAPVGRLLGTPAPTRGLPRPPSDLEQAASGVVLVVSPLASGAGIVLDREGYVLTNWHLLSEYSRVSVLLNDGQRQARRVPHVADVVKVNKLMDLALLRLSPVPEGLRPMRVASRWQVRPGERVYAFGYAPGGALEVVNGVVSRVLPAHLWYAGHNVIHRAGILEVAGEPPADSGGPLLSSKAEVIGINAPAIGGAGGYKAVDIATIQAFLSGPTRAAERR